MASLLLGNGLNYLGDNAVSWNRLLTSLIDNIEKTGIIDTDKKPFLHLYEEIYTRGIKYSQKSEDELKIHIVDAISVMRPNQFHSQIMSLPFNEVFTLNYDYNLTDNSERNNRETRFNMHRYQVAYNNKRVWHIHGELKNKDSIMLGYTHYINSINTMQTYLKKSNIEDNSSEWVDLFLTDDIYILGAGLDFEEIDIWWLLSFRNREILNGHLEQKKITYINMEQEALVENLNMEQEALVENLLSEDSINQKKCKKIITKMEEILDDKVKEREAKAKISMLETFDVHIKTFYYQDKYNQQENYEQAIAFIEEDMQNIISS